MKVIEQRIIPTVNMESLACGTHVVTFNTGGSDEILDETCGSVVPCDDISAIKEEIITICETKPCRAESCTARATYFEQKERFAEYLRLYECKDK